MTAPCKIVARLKNDKIISIYSEIPDLFALCFEEEDFLEMMNEHEKIMNKKNFEIINHIPDSLEPCGEGIIFYDYKNKYAFSCQDYCDILDFSVRSITNESLFELFIYGKESLKDLFIDINEYMFGTKTKKLEEKIIKMLQEKLLFTDIFSKEPLNFKDTYNRLDNFLYERENTYIKYKVFNKVKNKGCFKKKLNNEELKIKDLNVFDALYSFHIVDDYFGEKVDPYLAILNIDYPDWKLIFDNKDNIKNLKLLKSYMDKENLLSEKDKLEWDEFISCQ
jgi:hypothetical protein